MYMYIHSMRYVAWACHSRLNFDHVATYICMYIDIVADHSKPTICSITQIIDLQVKFLCY